MSCTSPTRTTRATPLPSSHPVRYGDPLSFAREPRDHCPASLQLTVDRTGWCEPHRHHLAVRFSQSRSAMQPQPRTPLRCSELSWSTRASPPPPRKASNHGGPNRSMRASSARDSPILQYDQGKVRWRKTRTRIRPAARDSPEAQPLVSGWARDGVPSTPARGAAACGAPAEGDAACWSSFACPLLAGPLHRHVPVHRSRSAILRWKFKRKEEA